MDLVYKRNFVTSNSGHLENVSSLNYADLLQSCKYLEASLWLSSSVLLYYVGSGYRAAWIQALTLLFTSSIILSVTQLVWLSFRASKIGMVVPTHFILLLRIHWEIPWKAFRWQQAYSKCSGVSLCWFLCFCFILALRLFSGTLDSLVRFLLLNMDFICVLIRIFPSHMLIVSYSLS